MKKLVALLAVLTMLAPSALMPSEINAISRPVSVTVDNQNVNFPDGRPYLDTNGRVLVPVRFVSEALGAKVDWDASSQVAVIEKEPDKVAVKIGEKTVKKNDKVITMDTTAVISSGRTMVPVRFVSEALGAKVAWDKVTYTVVITTDGSEPVVSKEPVKPQGNMTAAGIPVELYNKFHPELKKVHDSRLLSKDGYGTDLTQPESILNPMGLMSERQALEILYVATNPDGEAMQRWAKEYNDGALTKEDIDSLTKGDIKKYTERSSIKSSLDYPERMKLITDNNLIINNMSNIMIELRDGKYRLNVQAIGGDMFNLDAGYQFLQGQVDGRDIYSKTIAEPWPQSSTEWVPIPAYWN